MKRDDLHFEAGIPSLNLKDFTAGNASEQERFVAQLGAAYEGIGFAAISGHGISDALIAELYKEAEAFFQLPSETKMRHARPESRHQRGYVRMGVEHAKDSDAADLKEFWQVGQPAPPADAAPDEFPENVAVGELPRFSAIAQEAFVALENLGQTMLRAIARHLQLNETYFQPWVQGGTSILRAIHYPPITREPDSAVRSGQHEDINLITLLVGASAAGLQVLDHDGNWVDVTALPEHIVVNVGDMLQRLTNHKLKSTTHRVVNPPRELWGTSRYSMPFFCHPRPDMPLDALPNCVAAGESPREPGITAGAYLTQRLIEIGLLEGK